MLLGSLDEGGGSGVFIGFGRRQVWGKFGEHGSELILKGLVLLAHQIQFFLDVGAFGPFPELRFFLLFGLADEEVEALFFDGDAAGVEVAAAEGDDIGGEEA